MTPNASWTQRIHRLPVLAFPMAECGALGRRFGFIQLWDRAISTETKRHSRRRIRVGGAGMSERIARVGREFSPGCAPSAPTNCPGGLVSAEQAAARHGVQDVLAVPVDFAEALTERRTAARPRRSVTGPCSLLSRSCRPLAVPSRSINVILHQRGDGGRPPGQNPTVSDGPLPTTCFTRGIGLKSEGRRWAIQETAAQEKTEGRRGFNRQRRSPRQRHSPVAISAATVPFPTGVHEATTVNQNRPPRAHGRSSGKLAPRVVVCCEGSPRHWESS